ncbi:hypothetical protein AOQ84DRAFT_40665 [Glonium stellatum]|uniref:Uncharacterized protein n=1 Tax=Glonium stellatum TaxID=574774 RepID=A0A8E2F0W4_9PEZI|nr:hypothetical protein AOQ84DRAFT_40665 [Glonium stellatum]
MAAEPTPPTRVLSEADTQHFLTHGWVKLTGCFTRSQAADITSTVWTRLGMSPMDKTTWTAERINMPWHQSFSVADFAPKAWTAICELLGGVERVSAGGSTWKDSFIVNLGTPAGEGKNVPGEKLFGWHVDGDFFIHYLDSPEQALLVIPLFTDISPGGGGTMLCPGAIKRVAKHLEAHPEGVSPRMTPRALNPSMEQEKTGLSWFNELAKQCKEEGFVEATGEVGDVYLLHPLMLHSASNNALRVPRIITNPPVSLRQPFCFDRDDESQYSWVELKTLRELGKTRLEGWKIQGPRDRIVPERVRVQERMKREELERMKGLQTAVA